MSLKFIDNYNMEYNGEQLEVMLHYSGYNNERIEFDYRGHRVYMFYNRNKYHWYNLSVMICRIIDNIGIEGFEKFKEYEETIEMMKSNYIIIEDNVYKPHIKTIPNGSLNYYMMLIKMTDNKILDGSPLYKSPYTKIEKQDHYSKIKTFDNLVSKVINYYKNNNVLPSDEYLLKDKTKEYREIQQWFKENKIYGSY